MRGEMEKMQTTDFYGRKKMRSEEQDATELQRERERERDASN